MTIKRFLHWPGCTLFLCLAVLHPSAQAQTIPNAPTNLAAFVISALQINLSWTDASTNEDGFKVERSLDGINFSQIAQVSSNARLTVTPDCSPTPPISTASAPTIPVVFPPTLPWPGQYTRNAVPAVCCRMGLRWR